MVRRACAVSAFAIVALALTAATALAYEPLTSYSVEPGARLVAGAGQATYMWPGPGGASLEAARVPPGAGAPEGPYTVVPHIAAPGDWYASGDGLDVTVTWKDGDTVYVKRFDLSTGTDVYGAKPVCTDAQAAALRDTPGTTVRPAGVSTDGNGGAYVWCSVSPSPNDGYTLLNHVDGNGVLATSTPAMKALTRTVVALDSDDAGHACVLLAGASDVTVDRLGPTLAGDWKGGARSPYLLPPRPTPHMAALDLVATRDVFVDWREGDKVKAQRFDASGDRLWLVPPATAMGGVVKLTSDGSGGVYIAGPSGDGIVARHILATGREAAWSPSRLGGLGLTAPQVDAVTGNRAGDLFAAYSDGAAVGSSGVAQMTYTGSWGDTSPAPAPDTYSGAEPDGAGGAWVLGAGTGAALWRISRADRAVTLRPRALVVPYGKSIVLAGYSTAQGGVPARGTVVLGTVARGTFTRVAATTSDRTGYYQKAVRPKRNARWMARAGAQSEQVLIRVSPRVTLALSHRITGRRLVESFAGSVTPARKGARVLVQRRTSGGWRTVARGRVGARSRYRVSWRLPSRTATYKLRTVVKADSRFADGASTTATLRVRVRKG